MTKKNLHVAVGIVRNKNGDVLLGQRLPGKHLAGYWEFPGGKVEADETVQQALARELQEELGIQVRGSRPLITVRHDYPERSVLLDTWLVSEFEGEVADTGPEDQSLRWVHQELLSDWQLPPADRPIVDAIRLPDSYLITPDAQSQSELLAGVAAAINHGIKLIQLRGVAVDSPENTATIQRLIERCNDVSLICNVATPQQLDAAVKFGFAGVHLKSNLLSQLSSRPVAASLWLGCSVHNAAELVQAETIGADFAVLSPVAETDSHPGQPALGWQAAATLASSVNVPLYALGGMQTSDIPIAQQHGMQGIAAITALWPRAR